MMNILKLKCKRCGYEWIPRTENLPKQCPRCKSPFWQEDKRTKEYSCIICGYKWKGNPEREPQRCPHCNSRQWNGSPNLKLFVKCKNCEMILQPGDLCPNCLTKTYLKDVLEGKTKTLKVVEKELPEELKKEVEV